MNARVRQKSGRNRKRDSVNFTLPWDPRPPIHRPSHFSQGPVRHSTGCALSYDTLHQSRLLGLQPPRRFAEIVFTAVARRVSRSAFDLASESPNPRLCSIVRADRRDALVIPVARSPITQFLSSWSWTTQVPQRAPPARTDASRVA
jgi:hypothetical protein